MPQEYFAGKAKGKWSASWRYLRSRPSNASIKNYEAGHAAQYPYQLVVKVVYRRAVYVTPAETMSTADHRTTFEVERKSRISQAVFFYYWNYWIPLSCHDSTDSATLHSQECPSGNQISLERQHDLRSSRRDSSEGVTSLHMVTLSLCRSCRWWSDICV